MQNFIYFNKKEDRSNNRSEFYRTSRRYTQQYLILEYANSLFNGDKHQVTAFAYIVSAFVLRIYDRVDRDDGHIRKNKRIKLSSQDAFQFDANVSNADVTQAELRNYPFQKK